MGYLVVSTRHQTVAGFFLSLWYQHPGARKSSKICTKVLLVGTWVKKKTLARVKERYYWPGHYNDVKNWYRTCPNCAARKSPPHKARAPLRHIVAGAPMQIVAVEILGPFPESQTGNSYVLVAGDYFTRWVEAYPIPNQEAATVAKKLTDEFFFRFSPAEQLP